MKSENVTFSYGKVHKLKTWPSYFNAVMNEIKTFEVRKADRNFKQGDFLLLEEFDPNAEKYTGAVIARQISYVLPGGQFGIENGFVVLGIVKY